MKRENIKLRPTGLWLVFGPILGCMWLAAVNYANNLVYAILYLVGSLSLISIFHTWRNLSLVEVEHIRVYPAFVGEDVQVDIFLRVPGRQPVYGLTLSRVNDEAGLPRRSLFQWLWRHYIEGAEEESVWAKRPLSLTIRGEGNTLRIEPGDSCATEGVFPAVRRGMYRLDMVQIKSAYPFGLFWASFNVAVNAEYFIYPKPKGTEDWPELRSGGENGSPFSQKPGDDFYGVRPYTPAESLRHVDWKAYARGRPLSVKQFTGGGSLELWLDASSMERMPLEDRLSQLALWIVNAEKAEIPYALKLGRTTLSLGLGPTQSRRALETLAVAGMGSEKALK